LSSSYKIYKIIQLGNRATELDKQWIPMCKKINLIAKAKIKNTSATMLSSLKIKTRFSMTSSTPTTKTGDNF